MNLAYRTALMSGVASPSLSLDFTSGVLDPRITFSRASNAIMTDSTGKITYAPNNLLTYSQEFDNAAWAKTVATVTANATIAPDGTQTADVLTDTVDNDRHFAGQLVSTILNTTYVYSCFLKAGTLSFASVTLGNSATTDRYATATVDLSTGTITNTTSGTGTTASYSITSVGSGWYRVIIVARQSNTAFNAVRISTSDSGTPSYNTFGLPVYTGSGTGTVYIWGAQLEAVTYQTSPSTYVPTTASAYYGPRFDYDPVTLASKGLLIEEQRANLLVQSQTFDNGAWGKAAVTVTADAGTAPDGTTTADLLAANGTTAAHNTAAAVTLVNGSAYTFSCFVKAGTNDFVQLATNSVLGNLFANFQLSTATAGTTSAATTSAITSVGGSWYRVSMTFTATSASSAQIVIGIVSSNSAANRESNSLSTNLLIWGAQLEAGSFATSYIPTVASSVTRSADIASMTGSNFSSWFNQGPVNLLTYSEQFNNAAWTKTATGTGAAPTVTADAALAPDGTTTADLVSFNRGVGNAVGDSSIITQTVTVTSATAYAGSVYVKAGSVSDVGKQLAFRHAGGGSYQIITLTDDWVRVTRNETSASTSAVFTIGTRGTITTDNSVTALIWGAQLEVGSTATSYIPTTTAPASAQPAEGAFLVKGDLLATSSTTPAFFVVSDGTNSNRIRMLANNSVNRPQFDVFVNNVAQSSLFDFAFTLSANVPYSAMGVFKTNDFAMSTNGLTVQTDTSGQVAALNLIGIGNNNTNAGWLNGHIQYLRYYRNRLPNNILQQLTR